MPVNKIYRKLIPVNNYDIAGTESWLSDMANKGFFLYDLGSNIAKFTKDAPKSVRYRLEPVGKDKDYPSLVLYDLYKENGWKYIATYRKLFHVFMAEDASAQEIHTDPVVQSETLKKTVRQLRISTVAFLAFTLFFILTVSASRAGNNLVSSLLLDFDINCYIVVPVYMISGIIVGISARRVSRLRRRLRSGQPFEHHSKYKCGIVLKIMELIVAFASVFTLVAMLIVYGVTGFNNERPLSEAKIDMPVLSLADVDAVQYENYPGGSFYRKYTPLVPVQYVVTQWFHTTEEGYAPNVLQTNYYKTAFRSLAKPVYDEMIKIYIERIGRNADYEVLDTALFNKAIYMQVDDAQYIIAYSDKTVIVVRYVGGEYLPDKLELIADTFL